MRAILALLLALLPAAAGADSMIASLRSDAGLDYALTYVDGGFELRRVRLGLAAVEGRPVEGVERLRLLPGCEAAREVLPVMPGGQSVASDGPRLATGRWGWTEAGFVLDFPDGSVRFARGDFWPSGTVPCRR